MNASYFADFAAAYRVVFAKIIPGHLIACRPNGIKVGIQLIQALKMDLPMSLDYLNCDFKRDTAKYWDKSEK